MLFCISFLGGFIGKIKKENILNVFKYIFFVILISGLILFSEILSFSFSKLSNYIENKSPAINFIDSNRLLEEKIINLDIRKISSINSRLIILKNFPSQFIQSPIFGGWYPEISSGAGKGNFQHSFLLSILTHTGLLGFSLFISSFYKIVRIRFIKLANHSIDIFLNFQIIYIFFIANFIAFLIFPPFWFLFGFISPGFLNYKTTYDY